jgi:thiol-disulfide isomerase/thioredoxin
MRFLIIGFSLLCLLTSFSGLTRTIEVKPQAVRTAKISTFFPQAYLFNKQKQLISYHTHYTTELVKGFKNTKAVADADKITAALLRLIKEPLVLDGNDYLLYYLVSNGVADGCDPCKKQEKLMARLAKKYKVKIIKILKQHHF